MSAKLEAYLREVDARLRGKPDAERREILATLRQHIAESLARHGNDVEAVLAELDSPDDYADDGGAGSEGVAPVVRHARAPSRWWFILALCFLLMNGYAVWLLSQGRAAFEAKAPAEVASPEATSAPAPAAEPLQLLAAWQVNISSDREVSLALRFNRLPDVRLLPRFLSLSTATSPELSFALIGDVQGSTVFLKTGTVDQDALTLALAAGLPSSDGAATLAEAVQRRVDVVEEFQISDVRAMMPSFEAPSLRVSLSSSLDYATAREFIEVQPPVKFSLEPHWSGACLLRGAFEPRTTYRVTFLPGLRMANGGALSHPVVRAVQFPDREAAITIPTAGHYLSPKGNLQIPVAAVNVKEIAFSAEPVLPQNLLHYVLRLNNRAGGWIDDNENRMLGRGLVVTQAVAGLPNQEVQTRVDLRALVEGPPAGAYYLSATAEKGAQASQLVVATDLGISARRAKDGLFVWVNSLATAKAATGAEVVAYAENNEEVGRGIVRDDGTLFLPKSERGGEAYLLIARLAGDLSYLALDGTSVEVPGSRGEREFVSEGYEAFVFTERGVYRPGETVHVRAVLRDSQLGSPESFPVSIRAVRPDGRTFKTFTLKLDDVGSCETQFELPDFLPTGLYSLEVVVPGTERVLGSTTVALEDFVPPQIRVDIADYPAVAPAGTAFHFTARSRHLFGAAAADLPVSAFVRFYEAPFRATNWVGYSFGDPEKKFAFPLTHIGKGRLNEEGLMVFAVTSSPAWRPSARLRAALAATVTEGSGRAVSAYENVIVDPYPFYIGLSPSFHGTLRVGETQRVSLVAVKAADGVALTNGALKVALSRATQSWALRRGSNGRYAYEFFETLAPVREVALPLGSEPTAFPFSVEASGNYLLVVSDPETGASSSLRFSAAAPGERWVDWNRERPDVVELSLDKDVYAPGDVAKLVVKAPFSGEALLTIESDRVLEHRRLELDGGTAEVALPLRAEFAPNVYCTIALLRPVGLGANGSPHRAVGAISLNVRPAGHALRVEVNAPATNVPQSKLTARIRVRDEAGKPVAARLTAMAVDEGICSLTAFKTPDPLGYFFAKRTLGIAWFDLYSLLMPVLDDEMNKAASHIGGGADSSLLRRLSPIKSRRFKPLALWQSEIQTDAQGEAEVSFDLPEFAGEVRLMVVAVNREQLGSGETSVKVKRPLVVETSLPRFLAPTDSAELTVQLFNESGTEQTVRLRATAGGPLSVADAERSVVLAPGASKRELMTIRALNEVGPGTVAIRVDSEAVSFTDDIEVPVRPTAPRQTISEWGALNAGDWRKVEAPSNYVPGTVEQVVRASAAPDVRLGAALDYLQSYPYWCLEQTTSRAFPLLHAPELAERISAAPMSREEAEGYIRRALLHLLAMQRADGGFAKWANESRTWVEGSLYAADFLQAAKDAGYEVPAAQLDAALKFVQAQLDRNPPANAAPSDAEWRHDVELRAYACRILAQAGRGADGWTARLAEQFDSLGALAQIHTARALILSGDPRRGGELLKRIHPESVADARAAASLLMAWLALDPAAPAVPLLAKAIEEDVGTEGHWETTTFNSYVVRALGEYARLMTNASAGYRGELRMGDTSVAFESSHAFIATNRGSFVLVNNGPGTMYCRTAVSGVPASGEVELGDHHLHVRREWLNAKGEPWGEEPIAQGDTIIVRLSVTPMDELVDDVIVEDLLPAGFEIENPALQTAQTLTFDWMKEKAGWCASREIRDDRLVLFSGAFGGEQVYYYAMRAVTPGSFVVPAVSASAMYQPMVRSAWRDRAEVTIAP